jgi:hypothetical protein
MCDSPALQGRVKEEQRDVFKAEIVAAPSTTLRVVPLPRFTGEEPDNNQRPSAPQGRNLSIARAG